MPENTKDRLLNKGAPPAPEEIEALLGADAASRLKGLEAFLQSGCDLTRELKFPFGEHYGWGYKFSRKSKLLCYAFFEKGAVHRHHHHRQRRAAGAV